jgi:hypothetical protein
MSAQIDDELWSAIADPSRRQVLDLLVSQRKQGRKVPYQVEAGRLDQAARAMAELAAQWDRDSPRSNGSPKPRTRRTRGGDRHDG